MGQGMKARDRFSMRKNVSRRRSTLPGEKRPEGMKRARGGIVLDIPAIWNWEKGVRRIFENSSILPDYPKGEIPEEWEKTLKTFHPDA